MSNSGEDESLSQRNVPNIEYEHADTSMLRDAAMKLMRETTSLLVPIVIGGDRLSVCDEGFVAKDGDRIVGVATIALKGEGGSGPTEVVGVYVTRQQAQKYRKSGIGAELLERAVDHCKNTLGVSSVHMSAVYPKGARLVKKLLERRPDLKDFIHMQDLSGDPLAELIEKASEPDIPEEEI